MSIRVAAVGPSVIALVLLAIQTSAASAASGAEASWSSTATSMRCEIGARRTFTCPARGSRATVWGDGPYTDDSSICTAAVHAGVISFERGGEVTIEMRAGASSYRASAVGGVSTLGYGAWSCSFEVVRPAARAAREPEPEPVSGVGVGDSRPLASPASPASPAGAPSCDSDPADVPPPPARAEPRDVAGVGLGIDVLRASSSGDALRTGANGMFALRTTMHGRASRRVAIVLGMEEGFGVDPSGYRRYDLAFSLPEMYFYLTPDSPIQLYTLTGFELRLSHFDTGPDRPLPIGTPWTNTYLGAVLGAGLETRVHDKTALRFEVRGFLRGRVDGSTEDAAFSAATSTGRGVSLGVGMVFF